MIRYAFEFVATQPGAIDAILDVEDMFSRRGGYAKFEALLMRRHALDRWHAFKAKATNQALRDWCKANAIELSD